MSNTLGHGDTCRLITHPTPSTSHYDYYTLPHTQVLVPTLDGRWQRIHPGEI